MKIAPSVRFRTRSQPRMNQRFAGDFSRAGNLASGYDRETRTRETVLHSHPNGTQKPNGAPQRLKHEGLLSPCGTDLRFLLGESHTLIEMGSFVNGTCACCRTTSAGLGEDSLGVGSHPLVESRAFDPCFGFHILLDFSSLVMTAAPHAILRFYPKENLLILKTNAARAVAPFDRTNPSPVTRGQSFISGRGSCRS